jgi:hypothetical protein
MVSLPQPLLDSGLPSPQRLGPSAVLLVLRPRGGNHSAYFGGVCILQGGLVSSSSMAGLQRCTPTAQVWKFQDWWQAAEKMVPNQIRVVSTLLFRWCCGIFGNTVMPVFSRGCPPRCLGSSLTSAMTSICGAWPVPRV